MAQAFWLSIFVLIWVMLGYIWKRVVQKKSKEEIQLEGLRQAEIDLIISNSIFKSKAKKEKELQEIREEITTLEKKMTEVS